MPRVAPYGSWVSPIDAESVASSSVRLSGLALDGGDVYWTEGRPTEGGRTVIVGRTAGGQSIDATPTGFNVRTLAHEYGGGAFVVADGVVFFVNYDDQRIYRHRAGEPPQPLTPDVPDRKLRYADLVVDRRHNRLICVVEDHREAGEAANRLGAVSLRDGSLTILAQGYDFYSSPAVAPDGSRLAWQCWRHPNMPWDGSECHLADVSAEGRLGPAQLVAGGPSESVFQPEFGPDGTLHVVSDRNGWWNLYRWLDGRLEPLGEMAAEFGQPQWNFGVRTYGFETATRIVTWREQDGLSRIATIDSAAGTLEPLETGRTSLMNLRVGSGTVVFVGASPSEPLSVVRVNLGTLGASVLRRSSDLRIDEGYLSTPRSIDLPTTGGRVAHGIFYEPRNRDFAGPPGELPPLLVLSHGGPTSAASTGFSASIQYWTSRGFAVLDVDYGGSTGYGRAYRERLNGAWGVVDVDDCANGARHLAAQGLVDGERMAIRGGSAGGYTTLAALAFRDVFRAGASYYGVSDLEALATDTHKFEARYLDSLIGPYPERRDLYVARSPIHHADGLNCPVIFFQGLEDRVVPPDQAERMVEALRARGIAVEYHPFEGEQHGFRRAENVRRCLEAELAFYAGVFRFALPEPVGSNTAR